MTKIIINNIINRKNIRRYSEAKELGKGNVRETLLGERHFVLLLLFNDRLDSLGNFLTSESGTGFLVSKC